MRSALNKLINKSGRLVRNIANPITELIAGHGNIAYFIILTGITFIVFGAYILCEKYFIFNDVASDSFYQTYNYAYYYTKAFQDGNALDMWNSFIGLGKRADLVYFNIFNWIYYFGTEHIEYLTGISQVIKVLLSGCFFYAYMRTMDRSKTTSAVCGIFYAYCGHMVLRGSWANYPNEAVAVAFWLYSFERYHKKGKILLLPISTAIIFTSLSGYYVILYTGIFFVYAIFRYCCENKVEASRLIRFMGSFGGCWLLALGISNFVVSEGLLEIFGSSRFAKDLTSFSGKDVALFSEDNFKMLYTAFYRTIGMDIIGGGGYSYAGSRNLLADGTFYCGILSLFLIPYGMQGENKKIKMWYMLGAGSAAAYIIIPEIRTILSGFQIKNFKISSLWVIVLMLLLASAGLEKVLRKCRGNTKTMYVTAGILVAMTVCIQIVFKVKIHYDRLIVTGVFMAAYIILIWYYTNHAKFTRKMFGLAVVALAGIEVTVLSYGIINDRGCINSDIIKEKVYYNDYTNEAIAYIKSIDNSCFYRIDKEYNSVYLNDSWVQGYNGVKVYLGGTGVSKYMSNYLDVFGLPYYMNAIGYQGGYSGIVQMDDITACKYMLSKAENLNAGYRYVNKIGDIFIYENLNARSLGNIYYSSISTSELRKENIAARRDLALYNAVLPDENADKYEKKIHEAPAFENVLVSRQEDGKFIFSGIEKDDVMVVEVSGSSTEFVHDIYIKINEGDQLIYNNVINIKKEENSFSFILTNTETDNIEIQKHDKVGDIDLTVKKLPAKQYQEWYNKINKDIEPVQITSFSNDNIKGKYTSEKDGILCLSIPYDMGWKIYVDGIEKQVVNCNVGFIGAFIEAGEHEVVIAYERPFLWIRVMIMLGSVLLYLIIGVMTIVRKKNGLEMEK